MQVPFLDLKTPHIKMEEELLSVVRDCLRNASFIGGKYVTGFEKEFARFCEARYCIGVNSGTDALRFALMAAGIGPGDEVITVPNTFIATTEAITQAGAGIAFVDIDEKTYNMDPNKLDEYLKKRFNSSTSARQRGGTGSRPRAVIPVHLYGQPADMDAIKQVADRFELIVIEDACQAHGAQYFSGKENKWKKTGSMGLAAAFSFYPGKNLGACGEGGAVTTNDELIANKIRMIRDHGQAKKYYHDLEGYNGRLDAIQAGLLGIKLKSLPEWNEKRRQNAAFYTKYFSQPPTSCPLLPPFIPDWAKPVFHLYIARVAQREKLQAYLNENGIGTGLHYPVPVHLQKAYQGKGYKEGDYPITEKVSKEIISLPMFPELTKEQIGFVVEKINDFYKGK
ncbi:MAG: DegT/DnrJ/EryC1/StrS aminotransferase [Deltaproteobacteria bacterium]|nr:DegT/DnrJ/EryC1/StrS aminotransferase [Deltaproteobacteria bacterium]